MAKKKSKKIEVNFNQFFHLSSDLFFIFDRKGVILGVNDVCEKTLGYTKEELIGKEFTPFVHPDDIPGTYDRFEKLPKKETDEGFINRYRTKSGDYIYLEWRVAILPEVQYCSARDVTSRIKAEKELSESEQKYRSFFYNSPLPVWIYDTETLRFLEVNPAAVLLYGYSESEFLSMTIKDIRPTEDVERLLNYLASPVVSDASNVTWRHRKKNGEIIFTHVYASSIIHKEKKARFIVIDDITESIQAKRKIEEGERNFRSLAENSNDMIMRFDREFRHLYVNRISSRFLNIPAADFIGRTHKELGFPEESYRFWEETIASVFRTKQPYKNVTPINNGEYYFDWELIPETAKDGEVVSVLSISKDITAIINAQKSIEESEKYYRGLFEDHDAVQLIIDSEDGKIIDANNSAERYYGWTREELRNKYLWDISSLSEEELSRRLKMVSDKKRVHIETRHRLADGSLRDVEVIAGSVVREGRNYIQPVIFDITEKKQAQALIQEKNKELQELNAYKDRLFSIIAHDLRSPFHGLLGFAEIFAESALASDFELIRKLSPKMYMNVRKLYDLLDNLLAWSLIQRHEIRYDPLDISLKKTADLIIDGYHLTFEDKEIKVVNTISQGVMVRADKDHLSAIFRNLLSNAVKFTPRAGEITVSARPAEGMYEISVKDSGIGIPAEIAPQLFLDKKSAGRKGTAGEKSTGLGLLLVKDYVEKNGGRIWFESEEGKGTTFIFTLPAAF